MKRDIQVLIVEDEFITSDLIKDELLRIGYQVSGQARSAEEALHLLEKGGTDICMLDINIHGEIDGIKLAGVIRERHNMPVIFLTAFNDQKTIDRATEMRPSAYLTKPFKASEVYAALEIAIQQFHHEVTEAIEEKAEEEQDVAKGLHGTLFIKESHFYTKIHIEDILYVQSSMKYLEIFTVDQKFLVRKTFTEFMSLLPESQFIQPHRSYLVSLAHVEKVGPQFLLVGDIEVPISGSKKEEVYRHFNMLK